MADMSLFKIKAEIESAIFKCIWNSPSLLILDDIDVLVSAETENTDNRRCVQIAQLITSLLRGINRSSVGLAATGIDVDSAHPLLFNMYIFSETVEMNSLNKNHRAHFLFSEANSRSLECKHVDLERIATGLEGYLISDLKRLFKGVLEHATLRGFNGQSLSQTDFETSKKGFTPLSLVNVKLQSSLVDWNSIGGLTETKKTLLQTLKWPTMYPQIFAKSPLRLRSGILLYGYPGTGKTMLANAIAVESGLNFVSVNGPELLNKYIGSSEKSVRDVFERARAARPCVLFFDEFDSIAPRRFA